MLEKSRVSCTLPLFTNEHLDTEPSSRKIASQYTLLMVHARCMLRSLSVSILKISADSVTVHLSLAGRIAIHAQPCYRFKGVRNRDPICEQCSPPFARHHLKLATKSPCVGEKSALIHWPCLHRLLAWGSASPTKMHVPAPKSQLFTLYDNGSIMSCGSAAHCSRPPVSGDNIARLDCERLGI